MTLKNLDVEKALEPSDAERSQEPVNVDEAHEPEETINSHEDKVKIACGLRIILIILGLAIFILGIIRAVQLKGLAFGFVNILISPIVIVPNFCFLFQKMASKLSAGGMIVKEIVLCITWIILLGVAIVSSIRSICGVTTTETYGSSTFKHTGVKACKFGELVVGLAAIGLFFELNVLRMVIKKAWKVACKTKKQWDKPYMLRGAIYPSEKELFPYGAKVRDQRTSYGGDLGVPILGADGFVHYYKGRSRPYNPVIPIGGGGYGGFGGFGGDCGGGGGDCGGGGGGGC